MDYRTYVSRAKISSCLLVIFLFFAFPIFVYASDVTNVHDGSFSFGWSPYIPVSDYDKLDFLHVSSTASVTHTKIKDPSGSYQVYSYLHYYFYDSNYSEIFHEQVYRTYTNHYKGNGLPVTHSLSASLDYDLSSFDGFSNVAYVRILISGTNGAFSTSSGSGSYSISVGGSMRTVIDAVDEQTEVIKQQHQEEKDAADKVSTDASEGVGQLTDVLSSWEIIKMPFTFVTDFAGAITSEGSTGLTFPSFTLMGYTLWPSYTFDLEVIKEQFPLLYNSLHTITGIMVVGWFIHYLWRKWSLLTGDDTPEGN